MFNIIKVLALYHLICIWNAVYVQRVWWQCWSYVYIDMSCKSESYDYVVLYFRFICKNNGVIYESDLIQIGVKSEFRQNLGRLGLFYGNKSSLPFTVFSVEVVCPGTVGSDILLRKTWSQTYIKDNSLLISQLGLFCLKLVWSISVKTSLISVYTSMIN